MQYLTIWDLVLTPVYLIILSYLAKRHRDKHYPLGHPLRRYYLSGLYAKFGGAIFIGLVYQYYYGGGDTFTYYAQSKVLNSSLSESFTIWLKLMFHGSVENDPRLYKYIVQMYFYNDPSAYAVTRIAALTGLLNGTSYMPMALIFAFVTYTGIWSMYKTFTSLYPRLIYPLAISFLFIPSTIVWGSAIFKDTICMFGLGWMVYCTFRIFINRDLSFRNLFILAISFYLIAVVKVYILVAFIPALALWLLMSYSYKIKSAGIRFIITLLFAGITAAGFLFFSRLFSNELSRYSLDKIAQTAKVTGGWIYYSSGDEGSSYDLGNFSPTIGGMLSKFPQAVVVTLYRPFIWESRKVIVALSALEAFLFLFYTLKVIFRNKLNAIKQLSKDPNLIFCLIFSLIFAFAVGISSYNFGALSRYKIPCLPFYATLLVVLLNSSKSKSQMKVRKKSMLPNRSLYTS